VTPDEFAHKYCTQIGILVVVVFAVFFLADMWQGRNDQMRRDFDLVANTTYEYIDELEDRVAVLECALGRRHPTEHYQDPCRGMR
jgi:hypothetical protein